jgi:predicted nucleotidyltransferase component of viral defense system
MIYKEEIDAKSVEFQVHRANVERDYVFGWLIYGLFTASNLKDILFLKGGNALRKGYFANTRYSNDLDFGIPGDISPDTLLTEINKVCDFIQQKASILFIKEDNKVEEKFSPSEVPIPGLKVYEARVYFKDFYGNTDQFRIKISMDITRFDKVLLPIQNVQLIHPYSDATKLTSTIRCMKLEEIIATKLKCLLQRQHAPDLFDYAYSIKLLGGQLNKQEVVETLIKKTIFERNPQVLKNILLKTSFDFFREYWSKSIVCAQSILITADDAIATFLGDLESLFSIYPNNGFTDFAFFGADARIPIMKAARSQTLLRVVYKGEERIVEPYSLKYLQKRDGQQREYFYVYNRSGGSNPPGVRCFVAENLQNVENTDKKFIPREGFIIELSKAGETPENPYLFDPNKPLPRPRVGFGIRRTIRSYGPKYIYQCNYCGKKFTKTRYSSTLNPHKDKNGYPCGGRYGIYVDTKY